MQKCSLISLVLLIQISCTEEASIDIPNQDNMLVVNSIFSPNQQLQVKLKDNQTNYPIEDAQIELIHNDKIYTTFQYKGDGIYALANFLPMKEEVYSLQINTPNYKNVLATDHIPEAIPIINIEHKDSTGTNALNLPYASLKLTIDDPGNQKNFYEIFVISKIDTSALIETDTTSYEDEWYEDFQQELKRELSWNFKALFSYQRVIKSEGYDTDIGPILSNQEQLVFSDNLINGTKTVLTIHYFPYNSLANTFKATERTLFVHLRSVSENYYWYKKKLFAYNQYQQTQIWRNTSDYVRLHSNINNGLGLFAGYSEFVDSIKIDDK